MPGPLGVIPGAIIVDPRHGMLLPQGRSRHELEPVIRDSLRILDFYLHAPEGQNLRREKRSLGAAQGLRLEKPSGVAGVAARRPEQRPLADVVAPRRRSKRSARPGHFALNSFAINPKPLNKTGTYYTLFAKVSEAMLQDLLAPNRAPAAENRKPEPPSGRYSGELFNYVRDGTATQKPPVGQRVRAIDRRLVSCIEATLSTQNKIAKSLWYGNIAHCFLCTLVFKSFAVIFSTSSVNER